MFKSKNENIGKYQCTVRLFEDTDILQCEFQQFHKGGYLLDYICELLQINEKDYFGLRFVDSSKQRHWLDLSKCIIKQYKDSTPILFSFRVKFYPADPFRLTSNCRFMLYQQLKRDLYHGRLYCSIGEAAALGALIVQDKLGDYDQKIHVDDYISSMHLTLRQTDILEKKIIEIHKKKKQCQSTESIVDEFLTIARNLDTYGVDPHPVKDHRGSQLYIGINHSGISTFDSGKRMQHFGWNEVHKLNFESKMFIAHLSCIDAGREPVRIKKHTIGYKCASGAACRYLWRCAVEQMLFFTLPHNRNEFIISGGGFFSRGIKLRYIGRTEREIITENLISHRLQKMAAISGNKRKASSVPATPSSPQSDLTQIRYSSLPRSTVSVPISNESQFAQQGNNTICKSFSSESADVPEYLTDESRLRALNIANIETFSEIMDYGAQDISERTPAGNRLPEAYILMDLGHHYKDYGTDPFSKLNASIQNFDTPNQIHNTFSSSLVREENAKNRENIYADQNTPKNTKSLQSDSEIFDSIRNTPEMITFRQQYYQPLKEIMLQRFK